MKQLTEQEAIALYDSKVYENWTAEQVVRLQLFQELLAVPIDLFIRSLKEVMGRPVFIHELAASNLNNIIEEYLGTRQAPTFEEIASLIPAEKRVVIGF